jgi:hypothetical protein
MLDKYDIKEFLDLLTKSNIQQLRAIHKQVVIELERRDKIEKTN